MRTFWVVALVAAFGCKGKKAEPPVKLPAVPEVAVATVLAKETPAPPAFYIVEDGGVRVAAAATWADLDAGKLKMTKKPKPMRSVDPRVREDFALDRGAMETVASMKRFEDDPDAVDIDLADLEDTTTRSNAYAQDDPPPPEEEDKPDDGADESGGTGTAMALEEGKMGKVDSDRAEGQYKMKKNTEDPQLARQQAIEQARKAGILGNSMSGAGVPPRGFAGHPNEDGSPSRVAKVEGTVMPDGKLDKMHAMLFVAPTAKATTLIDAIEQTDAAIAVSHQGKIRPLRLSFKFRELPGGGEYWLEARVTKDQITVEAVPDAAIAIKDTKELAATLDKARKARGAEDALVVDVLVDPDVTAQRLIDVAVALDQAGTRVIGMGKTPEPEELSRRGHRTPTTRFGQPNAQGDLDKALIRRIVKRARPEIQACYEKALAKHPDLAGTVQTQFFITPKGKVASATASGVDPDVASCIAEVIKKLEFPEPAGGGGVQVNYPFTMRP